MKVQYDVLSAILQHEFVSRGQEMLALPRWTTTDSATEESALPFLQSRFEGLEAATVKDYIRLNSERVAIEPLFELTVPVVLLDDDELKSIHAADGWDEFYRRYPASKGQISLSRVGFNPEKTQALACVGIQSRNRSGHGSFFLLEKESEQWHVKKSTSAWIS